MKFTWFYIKSVYLTVSLVAKLNSYGVAEENNSDQFI